MPPRTSGMPTASRTRAALRQRSPRASTLAELDPLSPIVAADHAVILNYARQYDRAIQAFEAVHAMDPKLGRANVIIQTYVEAGRPEEALAYLNAWRVVFPGPCELGQRGLHPRTHGSARGGGGRHRQDGGRPSALEV